jgi:putative transposase
MMRGNGGEDIFFDDDDRYHFYLFAQQGLERFSHRIHGFSCMTNHDHLVVQVGDIPLSKIIQILSFRYTRWINQRKKRIGHLFQGRYKALLIDADSYLLQLVRYIHLNPCRAGMVKDPIQYPWSGHRVYVGKEQLPWLTTEWVLGRFSQQKTAAKCRYAKFIQEGLGEGYRIEFHSGGEEDTRVLGEDRFVNRVFQGDRARLKPSSLKKIVQVVCNYYGIKECELSDRSRQRRLAEVRGVIAWLVVQNESGTLTELAQKFNRDLSALSLAARTIDEKRKERKEMKRMLVKLNNSITQA